MARAASLERVADPRDDAPASRAEGWWARAERWIGPGLVVLVLAVYAPVVRYGFVNFDDPEYVVENDWVKGGITPAALWWAFTRFHAANWHPLTWLSHMFDCQLFGLAAGGHHATNVVLHTAATLLLFVALRRMTGDAWRSGLVSALFALHPLRVESVAWIAERKDVLAASGWMLTLVAYARYVAAPTPRRYAAVLLAFVAGLLAKPIVVTLPLALLLLDVWPLARVARDGGSWSRVVVEKLPMLVLAAAVGALVFLAQRRAGAVVTFAAQPPRTRMANALLSSVAYLGATLWPHDLAVFYPPRAAFPASQLVGATLVLGGVTGAALALARRAPWFAVGWLWYFVTLLPVAGLIRAGDQAMADRFTYLPHVGLFVVLVWGLAALRAPRLLPAAGAVLALAGCVVGTRLQLRHWRDSEALFSHALAVTERNAVAHTNYGFALLERGRAAEAVEHFERAVAIEPWYAKAWVNLGLGLAALGRSEEAIARYRDAIRLDPGFAPAHYDLGLELSEHGRLDDAIAEFRETLRLDPGQAKGENGLGLALARSGRLREAVDHYRAALALDPRLVAVHNNLAVALEELGRVDEAIAHYREAVRLVPDETRAHLNLAAALSGVQRLDEAASEYREVLRRRPDVVEAHLALGDVLLAAGRDADAIAEYRAALAARPAWVAAESRLAWALATRSGEAAEAVRLAEHARAATDGTDPAVLRTVAAAYAAMGRFRDAADVARLALARARAAGREPLAGDLERDMATYEAGRQRRARD